MIASEQILEMLSKVVVASEAPEGGIRVSTHVLYPSNGTVSVVVRGGENSFMISDDGGGVSELSSSGIRGPVSDRAIKAQVHMSGLRVHNSAIISPLVPLDAVPAAILLVANASRTVAEWGLRHLPFAAPRNFKKELAELLDRYFNDNVKSDQTILGRSNKLHRFGHVVYLKGDRRLLIDPVVNDASSINSRLVANLDVKMAQDPLVDQLIVYDDRLTWRSSDLRLLEIGAPTVAFSHAPLEIQRRVA